MKNMSIFLCAVIMIAQLVSCSKKDSNTSNPATTPSLIASWKLIDVWADRPVPVGDTMLQHVWLEIAPCQAGYLQFSADGYLKTVQVNCNGDSSGGRFRYQLVNNHTALADSTGKPFASIIKLTADTLQFSGAAYSLDKNYDTVHYTSTMTYRKL